jgi:hypothetical protein
MIEKPSRRWTKTFITIFDTCESLLTSYGAIYSDAFDWLYNITGLAYTQRVWSVKRNNLSVPDSKKLENSEQKLSQ